MLVSLALATPAPARAQFGLGLGPSIVFDPTAVGKLVTQLNQQLQHIAIARQQLQAQLDATKKLQYPAWRSVVGTLAQIDQLTRQGQALSYSLATLDAEFRRTFPGNHVSATIATDLRTQDERTLATIAGALAAARASAQQFAVATSSLATMKAQVGSITSAQRAAELENAVGIHTAEELTLLRQQLAAQANAETVFLANQTNRDLEAAAAAQAFWRPGGPPPVRAKDMRVDAVGFVP
ncbi:MAG: hypothetical protein IRY91_03545 [Gemmatimonadaceae bacterium]|nr:hypothetical protein [Gemmatimonadaceae bacterium]